MSDKSPTLFPLPHPVGSAPRHAEMIRKFGKGPDDKRCKHCRFFLRRMYSKTYFKCRLYSTSGSESSDWRANWPACGRFISDEDTTGDRHD